MVPAKILIADDEPLNLMLFSEMIKPMGHSVILATDGIDASQKVLNEKPDLVILDWNMPRQDGFEALTQIKLEEATREIPVIMITGIMTSPENLKMALEAGAIDFLRKPFDKIELQARVNSVLLLAQSIRELNEKYQTIKRNNQFIRTLVESIPHPMVYYLLSGEVQEVNDRFGLLYNLSQSEMIGMKVYDLWSQTSSVPHRMKDAEMVKSQVEAIYEGSGGLESHDYIFTKTLFGTEKEHPEGILCVMTDISELKHAHNEILESKKRELTSSALRLIQISEMNNNIIVDLEKISDYVSDKGREYLKGTINRFSLNSGGGIWQEFETRFENVYESFYRSLNQLFPDLTPGEKKLCAFLRLNLSSKDIAALTFQNSQSVDMARYRLRKKLNLKQEENLIDFLMNIDS